MGFKILDREPPNYSTDGFCERTGLTDHNLCMAWVDNLQPESLAYTRKDCLDAVSFYPASHKAGHYTDIAHYCSMRMTKMGDNLPEQYT